MKLLLAILLQLTFLPTIFALYTGNPSDPFLGNKGLFCGNNSWWSPKIGYLRDYISDRKLESKDLPFRRNDQFTFTWDQAMIAFDFCNRVEVYGTVGAGSVLITNRPDTLASFQMHRDFQSRDGTTWGVGSKVVVFEQCDTLFGIDGKYQEFFTKMAWDGVHDGMRPSGTRLDYKEWQVSLGVAHNFCYLVPYISLNFSGLTHSKLKDLQNPSADAVTTNLAQIRLHVRRHTGLAIGTSFVTETFYVTAEARFINERSISFAAILKI